MRAQGGLETGVAAMRRPWHDGRRGPALTLRSSGASSGGLAPSGVKVVLLIAVTEGPVADEVRRGPANLVMAAMAKGRWSPR